MLPGRLCIGILEEDNPLKSYFRLKPLLVEVDGKYEVFANEGQYPEDGCIRIVPDKNESSHFKGRMRRMGRYCMLDLRDHIGENDKIRPNKNYRSDETERNANIVYSDVVREPAENLIFEVVDFDPLEDHWMGELPGSARFLAPNDMQTWRCLPIEEDGDRYRAERDGGVLREEELQRFDLAGFPGQTLRLAVRLPGTLPSLIGAPPKMETLPPLRTTRPPLPEPAPIRATAPVPAPKPVAEDKPWISRDHMPPPPPLSHGRMSPLQQTLMAQSGLNPRRSRSLQEIIEDKWRHSRVDQLGHPVPAQAMGQPLENPVERAVNALREAWGISELRSRLVEAVGSLRDFSHSMETHQLSAEEAQRRRELEDMEADRLRALDDLDKLRRSKRDLRETFKQEIRQEEADAFRDAVARTRAAQEECARLESLAEDARKRAEIAEDSFLSLTDGRFEEKLKDFALSSRAAELLGKPSALSAARPVMGDARPDWSEWLLRLRDTLAAEGLQLPEEQIANLLVCAALSDTLILSGSALSDKLSVARAIARAIGAYREISGDEADFKDAAIVVVRDANRKPDADIFRGLADPERRVIAVVSDVGSGFPISSEALARSFFIRLEAPAADSPWKPLSPCEPRIEPASVAALRSALPRPTDELPAIMERRLQKLRDALAMHKLRLSRNALDQLWRYCAAMLQLTTLAPEDVLDQALAQRALPCILAEAPVECLVEMKNLLSDLPRCRALLDMPLPILV